MKLTEVIEKSSKEITQTSGILLYRKKDITPEMLEGFEIGDNYKAHRALVLYAIKRGLSFGASFLEREGAEGLEVSDRFVAGFGKVWQALEEEKGIIEIPQARLFIACGELDGKKAVFIKRKTSQILVIENC